MIHDAHLSDRMAAVVNGRSTWTPAEAMHLAECPQCDTELTLLHEVRSLGDSAPMVDAARLSALVLPRVRAARRADQRTRFGAWGAVVLAAAASVMLVVLPAVRRPATETIAVVALAELDGLDPEGLRGVLESIDAGLPATEPTDEGALTGLDATDLDAVFDGLEG